MLAEFPSSEPVQDVHHEIVMAYSRKKGIAGARNPICSGAPVVGLRVRLALCAFDLANYSLAFQ